ncbi:MAG: Protein TusC [Candidatus Celerinatantimonas neptuna]|nr:MAG: Protein TusC [Candidatus Celerinatantimonas neptuna]
MKSTLFILESAPHGSSCSREALDAILATSAIHDDISVLFDGDGVWQLIKGQHPQVILQRHIEPTFAMLSLYDIENIYVAEHAMQHRALSEEIFCIDIQPINDAMVRDLIHRHELILRF